MHRITLGNTVFEGLNNAYLLGADDGEGKGASASAESSGSAGELGGPVTLVDTGISMPDVRADLEGGLDTAGIDVSDVEQVLLTHWHEDHAGLAGWIQAESGATVRAHADDVPLIEGGSDARAAMETRQRALFTEWGMPDEPRRELLDFTSGFDDARGSPADVTPFEDGERFRAGGHEIEAVHLPGHAAGLSGFVIPNDGIDREESELFSGDALLPHYTPNVGGADVRVDRPLAKYLKTLTRIVDREFAVAWPGHRDPIDDPSARAREIAIHHRERTERVVEILREHGPVDAWTVSSRLFGTLSEIHILHGPGEAYAHLDHLTDGVVERVDEADGGSETGERRVTYRLVERDPDLDRLFPEIALADV